MTKVVGFFGGSFDPIHLGHLNLAMALMERGKLNEVWFCPACISPHKTEVLTTESKHRLKMVELAVSDISSFKVLDDEIMRSGPSYTFDTLESLTSQHPDIQFRLLLGEDSLLEFDDWHRVKELVEMAPPLVGSRHGVNAFVSDLVRKILDNSMVRTPIIEISSTEIRERLMKGLYCGHLLPKKILDYIYQNRLYLYASQ